MADKEMLKKVALLLISNSPYEADVNALDDFMVANGFKNIAELEAHIKSELGTEYPEVLPSSFIYGDGL
jgi:hypothetical protein